MSNYPFTLTFSKTFTQGNLTGLTVTGQKLGVFSEDEGRETMSLYAKLAERNGWTPGEDFTVTAN